jgi:geranylgeranyl transferase type-2 subunit beta
MSYLAGLTLRLAEGAMQFDDDFRRRHAAWFVAAQTADGGFAGREGPADLYYTGFGLRALALLDALTEPIAERLAGYLRVQLAKPQAAWAEVSSVDFLSLVFSAALLEVVADIDVFADVGLDPCETVLRVTEPLRRDDGGFAKSAPSFRSASTGRSSTYQTFLVIACRQLVGIPIDDGDRLAALVRSRQRADGGFVELDRLPHSGVNPTAAAIGLLRLLDALDEPTRKSTVAYLAAMQGIEGGLRANTRIPLADLLSTFTGLAALDDLGGFGAVDLAAVRRFVTAMEMPGGGFRAGAWDDGPDVEYNSYGLGAMALLNVAEGSIGE